MTPSLKLPKDWREFLALLISKEVEFIIVGAWALSIHGKPRYSADIDVFVRPSLENATKLLQALAEFGFGSLSLTATDLAAPNKRLTLGREPFQIDLMTAISGVSFDQALQGRIFAQLEDLNLPFLGLKDLLQNKRSAGRDKDLFDIGELEKLTQAKDDLKKF